MQTKAHLDLSVLPKHAQEELYDFFLFLKQRYAYNHSQKIESKETKVIAEEIFPRKLSSLKPLIRDELYDR